MKRSWTTLCLFAVLSLAISVISLPSAQAAVAPVIKSLGQIREGLDVPAEIDIDAAGNLFVADLGLKAVLKIDKYGKVAQSFVSAPVSGRGLAVSPDGSRLFVAGKDSVAILDGVSGETIGFLGQGAGEFESAGPVDIDSQGFVFAADCGALLVKVYDPSGKFQYSFGSAGTLAGTFWNISSLRIQADQVYVGDPSSKAPRIQVFGLNGTLLRTISTTAGFGAPALAAIQEIVFDTFGRGYFFDFYGSRIKVLGMPGQILPPLGPEIDGIRLGLISNAAYDATTQRLFMVVDNYRLEVFGIDGGANPLAPSNHPPSAPVAQSPMAGVEVTSAAPELVFAKSTDPDGDAVVYQFRLLLQGEEVDGQVSVVEAGDIVRAVPGIELVENAAYTWQVRASDGKETSAWSAPASFYVNATEEPPSAPVIVTPLAGELRKGEEFLQWDAAADPDPLDQVGYRIEISSSADFASDLMSAPVDGLSAQLDGLPDYLDLRTGKTYFWRVVSMDNHGLTSVSDPVGSFQFFATDLVVDSNMPGAQVFAGGNLAYPGRYLGEAPLRLRDFPAGLTDLVVERAGFEPLAATIAVGEGLEASFYAELTPALIPDGYKLQPVLNEEGSLLVGGTGAPFLVDFDQDGIPDLLVSGDNGALALFKGEKDGKGELVYPAGVPLEWASSAGAVPFFVDWNNDGRQDLLLGTRNGTIQLYLNAGAADEQIFLSPVLLNSAGVPIAIEGAAPAVVDFGGDRIKDLVVGSASGTVYLYPNLGSDSAPELGAPMVLAALPGPVYPFPVDWDADGVREFVLSAGNGLNIYRLQAGNSLQLDKPLPSIPGMGNSNGNGNSNNPNISSRIFICDLDGVSGKDLVLGRSSGLRLALAESETFSPAFFAALQDKVKQIETLAADSSSAGAASLGTLAGAIENRELAAASNEAGKLRGQVEAGSALEKAVLELQKLLQ